MAQNDLHPVITVRLFTDEKCFGPGVAMLLRRVQALRSLRAAAQDMGMAYSKAWTILRTAEQELGFKLLVTTVGGKNGGGATLTAEGAAMLEAYEGFQQALRSQGDALFQKYFSEFI